MRQPRMGADVLLIITVHPRLRLDLVYEVKVDILATGLDPNQCPTRAVLATRGQTFLLAVGQVTI